jgi:hypothetical protein
MVWYTAPVAFFGCLEGAVPGLIWSNELITFPSIAKIAQM